MTHYELMHVMRKVYYPARRPVMMWGPPGVGKSDLWKQFAAAVNADFMVLDSTYLFDPADNSGIPGVGEDEHGNKITRWYPPEHFARLSSSNKPTVVLLDELPQLPPTSYAACFRMILHNEMRGIKFPPNIYFCGAGNRVSDSAGANAMPSPLANRMAHVNLGFKVGRVIGDESPDGGWVQWGLDNGIATPLLAYHRSRVTMLYPMFNNTGNPAKCELNNTHKLDGWALCSSCLRSHREFPSLRSWEILSDVFKQNPDPAIEFEVYSGIVGPEAAVDFMGYLRMYRELPSIDAILMGPRTCKVPKEPGTLYAVATALGRVANEANIDSVVQYAERMPPEYATVLMKDATWRDKRITNTRAYLKWASKNSAVVLPNNN